MKTKFLFVLITLFLFLGCGTKNKEKSNDSILIESEPSPSETESRPSTSEKISRPSPSEIESKSNTSKTKSRSSTSETESKSSTPILRPWPLPKPSTKMKIPRALFANCKTLLDVDATLNNALHTNDYNDLSYYVVQPENRNIIGYALVTRLEQIDENGFPKESPNRWSANQMENKDEGFFEWFKSALFPKSGYFRVIVFLVIDEGFTVSEETMERENAQALLDRGFSDFPREVIDTKFTKEHHVTALIYEYKVLDDNSKANLVNDGMDAKEHLKKAKIWSVLNKE